TIKVNSGNGQLIVAPPPAVAETSTITATLNFGVSAQQYGTLTFDGSMSTIKASVHGAFAGMAVGDSFTVTGAVNDSDNRTYTVTANDGTTMSVDPPPGGIQKMSSVLYGNLTIDPVGGTISATTTTAFDGVTPGTQFTLTGSPQVSNNQTYTVTANNGNGQLTVTPLPGVIESNTTTDTLNFAVGEAQTTTSVLTPNVFSSLPIGATFKVAGSGSPPAGNDQTYTVIANTGTALTVKPPPNATKVTAAATNGAADTTLTSVNPNNYYQGDQLTTQHRINSDTSIPLGITASNPAFEKAMRALGIIAQGNLANNPSRIKQAINLLSDALSHDKTVLPDEAAGGLDNVKQTLGEDAVQLNTANTSMTNYKSYLDQNAGNIINADPTTVVAELNLSTTALEVAMKALSMTSQLSLVRYM
ncbi:MAG: hypothetical protein HQL37_02925, partial [Alphaproteobacteria bacterium]|nr:hypothetical protein [Alphaproteobacteria bacterium]